MPPADALRTQCPLVTRGGECTASVPFVQPQGLPTRLSPTVLLASGTSLHPSLPRAPCPGSPVHSSYCFRLASETLQGVAGWPALHGAGVKGEGVWGAGEETTRCPSHLLRHRLMTLLTMLLVKYCLAICGWDAIRFLTV